MEKPPLFIVGMPRSGTKLLRRLLNNHSRVSILKNETEFLPYWEKKWAVWSGVSLKKYDNFLFFYNKVVKLPYFLNQFCQGNLIKPKVWHEKCYEYTLRGIFEALVRHDSSADIGMIWGDKSPGYIRHIPLVKRLFPEAKVIHIIRDVRDCCLSIKNAWGKNMIRSAQRWADDVTKARNDGVLLKDDYFELKYEELIYKPEIIISKICLFLGIDYENEMLKLETPTENYGDAKGKIEIVSNNRNKWKTSMDPITIHKIERICSKQLSQLKYPVSYIGNSCRIGHLKLLILKMLDALNLVKNDKDREKYIKSIIYHIRYSKIK